MNRIEHRMQELQQNKEKALITYMTAGLPDMEKTVEIIKEQANAGIDVIELGVPFSDPIADGPVIQDASYRSIQNGTSLVKVFAAVEQVRKDCEVPLIFMMYYNTILHYGVEAFVKKCREVGVDGLIVPDLPYEEQYELKAYLTEESPILIQLVSPVSKGRIPKLVKDAKGFIYCVSSMGVTGQGADFHANVNQYLKEVKAAADIPVMMGFGIRTAKDVEQQKETIDGAIVGSAFIKLMEENQYDARAIADYIRKFKAELNA
ncbi:MAG: tryptophan synthase subunit alpha [Lachnospiraceae bacterium]|nr:tryptophan synthase subunit alpha [Lachnospiraceae bacterium]